MSSVMHQLTGSQTIRDTLVNLDDYNKVWKFPTNSRLRFLYEKFKRKTVKEELQKTGSRPLYIGCNNSTLRLRDKTLEYVRSQLFGDCETDEEEEHYIIERNTTLSDFYMMVV